MQIIPSSQKIRMLLHIYIDNQVPRRPPTIPRLPHPHKVDAASIVHSGRNLYRNKLLPGPFAFP